MPGKATENRRFRRISFDAGCEIHCQDSVWSSKVLDISLKGILVERPEHWDAPLNRPCEVVIPLDDHETGIVMAVELRHIENRRLGFRCQYIDLETASHLKRLVELNLGDEVLLGREFAHLID